MRRAGRCKATALLPLPLPRPRPRPLVTGAAGATPSTVQAAPLVLMTKKKTTRAKTRPKKNALNESTQHFMQIACQISASAHYARTPVLQLKQRTDDFPSIPIPAANSNVLESRCMLYKVCCFCRVSVPPSSMLCKASGCVCVKMRVCAVCTVSIHPHSRLGQ